MSTFKGTPYEAYRQVSCGCCTGDGSGVVPTNDQCVCHIHQRYIGHARICAHHARQQKIIDCAKSCETFMTRARGWHVADSEDYVAADRNSARLYSEEAFRLAAGGAL